MCTCCRIWIKVLQRTDGGLTHVGKIPQGGALYIYQPPPPGFFEYYCYCTFDAHPRRGGTTSTPQPTPHNPRNRIGSRCKDKTERNVGRVRIGSGPGESPFTPHPPSPQTTVMQTKENPSDVFLIDCPSVCTPPP